MKQRPIPQWKLRQLADALLAHGGFAKNGQPLDEVDEVQNEFERQLAQIRGKGQVPPADYARRAVVDAKFEVAMNA